MTRIAAKPTLARRLRFWVTLWAAIVVFVPFTTFPIYQAFHHRAVLDAGAFVSYYFGELPERMIGGGIVSIIFALLGVYPLGAARRP